MIVMMMVRYCGSDNGDVDINDEEDDVHKEEFDDEHGVYYDD